MAKKKRSVSSRKQNIPQVPELDLHAHMHRHEHDHRVSVSPYPSANEIDRLHSINPEFATILMNTIAKRVEADIQIDHSKIKLEQKEQELRSQKLGILDRRLKRGQNYGLFALIFLGCITMSLVYMEVYIIAGFFATTTIVGSIVAFTGINMQSSKEDDTSTDESEEE